MANSAVVIYNSSREPVADLHRASGVSYEQRINEVHRAWFNLSIDDPHVSECVGMRYAEIWNGDDRVDLFRIVRKFKHRESDQTYYRFECEHVLVTLMDKRFQATTYSGPGTATSIGDVLAEQVTVNWQLGTCDFDRQFLYKWRPGTSLLEALISIPARFQCAYQLTFDTSSYPWTINLIEPPTTVTAYLDYSRNLKTIDIDEDFRGLYTRLYPYGAKAGEDQLDITGIEPSGYAYIENNVDAYGWIEQPWYDQRYTVAQNLYDAAVDRLALASVPKTRYTVGAADLYRLTEVSTDHFVLGALLSVNDTDMGVTIEARIVAVSKPDVDGMPGEVVIEIANKSEEFDLTRFVEVNDLSAMEMIAIPGGVVGALPATPTEAGLVACTDYFGFADGAGNWPMYMDKTGRLWADYGGYYFHFDPAASPPLQIKGDGEWLGTVLISKLVAGDLVVGMNLNTGGYIKSDNFVTDVSGWQINPDGSAEFQDVKVRGEIVANTGSVGSFTIGTYLYTGSKTAYNDANAGVHLGSDGIGIGNNLFTVSAAGAVNATNMTITGGSLNINSAFIVTVAGAVTCTNITITGGSLDINSAFTVSALGAVVCSNITATGGTIGGFTMDATEGFYAGSGATRIQMKPGVGHWLGATAYADAPYKVSPAGVVYAKEFYTLTDQSDEDIIKAGKFQGTWIFIKAVQDDNTGTNLALTADNLGTWDRLMVLWEAHNQEAWDEYIYVRFNNVALGNYDNMWRNNTADLNANEFNIAKIDSQRDCAGTMYIESNHQVTESPAPSPSCWWIGGGTQLHNHGSGWYKTDIYPITRLDFFGPAGVDKMTGYFAVYGMNYP